MVPASERASGRYAPIVGASGLVLIALALTLQRATVPATALGVLACLVGLLLWRPVISWVAQLSAVLVVIMFIPIRRYAFPGGLPFELEPYRLLLMLVLLGWGLALLVDREAPRIRRTGFELPFAIITIAILGSLLTNASAASEVTAEVIKAVMFFVLFIGFTYFATTVLMKGQALERAVKLLVICTAILGVLATIQYQTSYSIFDHIPFLEKVPLTKEDSRGGRLRSDASAEHPIALAALFATVLPLVPFVAARWGARWLLVAGPMLVGLTTTVSRTGITMLVIGLGVMAWLRPLTLAARAKEIAIVLVVFVFGIQVVAPGAIGTIRYQFFPEGGIVANQSTSRGSVTAGNRLTDIGPVLEEVAGEPLFDTGLVGALGWGWLFLRALRRGSDVAARASGAEGWLAVGITASIAGFAVGMLTYDAFSFVQETFILFFMLAASAVVASLAPRPQRRAPEAL
jgi:hypothetical protein